MVLISLEETIKLSETEFKGMANVSIPTRTINALMIINVIGKVIVKRVPLPNVVSTSTSPESLAIFFATTSSPTPLPEISVTCSAVENPGRKRK